MRIRTAKKIYMTTFTEIGIHENILKGLDMLGFSAPTSIQEQVIPLVLKSRADLVALAQTGTGKTAAFGIPLIQGVDINCKQTQALVLCPTRELCVQVTRDISDLARYMTGFKVVAVYGGANMERQINSLAKGAQIIVATPGRLNDLIRRQKVDLSAIRTVVLDEADEMLQMGFKEELDGILAQTPESKNTLLFSATMPKEVAAIASNYMTDPIEITIGQRNAGAENVNHLYYMVHARDRYLALRRIADSNPSMYGIVFCRTRQETKEVADKLLQDGYSADALHGELSQSQRDHVMNKFRRKNLQMLVATDVAARGLDVNDLTHVINYNLPDEIANYTHRSGRTGRAGKTGTSIAIIHMREAHKIKEIERKLKRRFEKRRIPTGNEICQTQLLTMIEGLKQVDIDHGQIAPFLAAISETLAHIDREELIKRFVSLEFNRYLEYYKDAPDLNVSEKGKHREPRNGKENTFSKHHQRQKLTRFFVNVGKKDGVQPMFFIGGIGGATGIPNVTIGKIEILNTFTIVEADSKYTREILSGFQHMVINGKDVSIEIARERGTKYGGAGFRKNRFQSKSSKNGQRKKGKKKGISKKNARASSATSIFL